MTLRVWTKIRPTAWESGPYIIEITRGQFEIWRKDGSREKFIEAHSTLYAAQAHVETLRGAQN